MSRRNSIRSKTVEKYLDDPIMLEKHKGHGFKDFRKFLKARKTLSEIADLFGVHRLTITKWLTELELERKK